MTLDEYSQYLIKTYRQLRDKYNLRSMEIAPCSIRSKESLRNFTQSIMEGLFNQTNVEFIESNDPNSVKLIVEGKIISLNLDTRYGHIEIDFFKVLEQIALQLKQLIKFVTFDPVYIAGPESNIKKAWSEGFPVQIDEVDFLHKHYTGKRYSDSEIGSQIIINEKISIDYFENKLLVWLNDFLRNKGKQIQFNTKQFIVYEHQKSSKSLALNGTYCGRFHQLGSQTIFDNKVLNQIFLINHYKDKSNYPFIYRTKKKMDTIIDIPIETFLRSMGEDH